MYTVYVLVRKGLYRRVAVFYSADTLASYLEFNHADMIDVR